MTPITPVTPGFDLPVTTFAKNQPPYKPLPAFETGDGSVISRWRPSFSEWLRLVFGGTIWLTQRSFGEPLQPVKLTTECPISKRA